MQEGHAAPETRCRLVSPPSGAWADLVAHYTSKPLAPIAKSQNIHVFQGDWMLSAAPTFSGQLQCSDPNSSSKNECTFELVQVPTHGIVDLVPNGSWTYTGSVNVPSTCDLLIRNAESKSKVCSFPQKHIEQGLGGAALGEYDTFDEAKAACLGKKNCGGVVHSQREENADCWNACGQTSGPCAACDRGGFLCRAVS